MCVWFQRLHRRSIVNQQSTRSLGDQHIDSLPGKSIQSKALLKLNSDQKVEDKQHEDREEDVIQEDMADSGSGGVREQRRDFPLLSICVST